MWTLYIYSKARCQYVPMGFYRSNACAVRLVQDVAPETAVPTTTSAPETDVRKVLRNGRVLILRNNKTYTLTGVEVK